jgi:hypothetical protein
MRSAPVAHTGEQKDVQDAHHENSRFAVLNNLNLNDYRTRR